MKRSTWAIIVAAGSGTRYGGQKQFATIAGRTVVALAVEAVVGSVDGIVLVLPPDFVRGGDRHGTEQFPVPVASGSDDITLLGQIGLVTSAEPALKVAAGGESRAGSVRAGLEQIPQDCEIVVVHDAARPLASPELCRRVIEAVRAGADGAVPALPLTDTVKRIRGAEVAETVDRSALVRVQTPQAFDAAVLRQAHEGAPEATDDAGLLEASGSSVVVVPGEEHNVKITSKEDLAIASWWHERLLLGIPR